MSTMKPKASPKPALSPRKPEKSPATPGTEGKSPTNAEEALPQLVLPEDKQDVNDGTPKDTTTSNNILNLKVSSLQFRVEELELEMELKDMEVLQLTDELIDEKKASLDISDKYEDCIKTLQARFSAEHQALLDRNAALEKQLVETGGKAALEALSDPQEKEQLKVLVEKLTERNERLDERIQSLHDQIAELNALKELNEQFQEAQAEMEQELMRDIESKDSKVEDYKVAIATLAKDQMALQDVVQNMQQQNRDLQRQVHHSSNVAAATLAPTPVEEVSTKPTPRGVRKSAPPGSAPPPLPVVGVSGLSNVSESLLAGIKLQLESERAIGEWQAREMEVLEDSIPPELLGDTMKAYKVVTGLYRIVSNAQMICDHLYAYMMTPFLSEVTDISHENSEALRTLCIVNSSVATLGFHASSAIDSMKTVDLETFLTIGVSSVNSAVMGALESIQVIVDKCSTAQSVLAFGAWNTVDVESAAAQIESVVVKAVFGQTFSAQPDTIVCRFYGYRMRMAIAFLTLKGPKNNPEVAETIGKKLAESFKKVRQASESFVKRLVNHEKEGNIMPRNDKTKSNFTKITQVVKNLDAAVRQGKADQEVPTSFNTDVLKDFLRQGESQLLDLSTIKKAEPTALSPTASPTEKAEKATPEKEKGDKKTDKKEKETEKEKAEKAEKEKTEKEKVEKEKTEKKKKKKKKKKVLCVDT
eukprot:Platyproteum_vivax@DN2265_c0_g1_i1.p1